MAVYALACAGYVYAFVFKNERILGRLIWLVAAGFFFHCATMLAVYAETGHLPWAGDYESALMGGWFIVLFTLIVAFQRRELSMLALATVPVTLLMMGYGMMNKKELGPMAASLKTVWLYIHVYFAWLAYGAYMLAMAAGVMYLLKQRATRHGVDNPFYVRMPSLGRLEELIFRYVSFGFITNAIEMAAGSIWAKDLWGSYWSWDPIEVWALVGWLQYGLFIHLRLTRGWRGVKLAWLSIAAVVAVVISFFGVSIAVEASMHVLNVR